MSAPPKSGPKRRRPNSWPLARGWCVRRLRHWARASGRHARKYEACLWQRKGAFGPGDGRIPVQNDGWGRLHGQGIGLPDYGTASEMGTQSPARYPKSVAGPSLFDGGWRRNYRCRERGVTVPPFPGSSWWNVTGNSGAGHARPGTLPACDLEVHQIVLCRLAGGGYFSGGRSDMDADH